MLNNTRQNKILHYLKQNSAATVKELAAALYVSDATIRRDLAEMQSLGLITRSHGGAILLEAADEISIFVRMTENAKEKEVVASKALRYIPAEANTVFLDSSSTVLALAQRMNLSNKTVVTTSLQTAMQLSKVKDINLLIPGGTIMATGTGVTGSWTNNLLAEFRFDLMLASCAAIFERGAYETSLAQREVKRTVFERSSCRILVADRTKLSAKGSYLFRPLELFDRIIFNSLTEKEKSEFNGLPIVC